MLHFVVGMVVGAVIVVVVPKAYAWVKSKVTKAESGVKSDLSKLITNVKKQ